MKRLLTWSVLCFIGLSTSAQNTPAFRQFYFNPYIFNPAFAGIEGYSELFVYHRQQWLNFNNAPSASGFNLQYAGKNRVGYGFNFTTQEVVALRNTSAMLTFAYRVPFSHRHYLSFGISGGIGANNLKLDDKDYSNDPAVLGAADNTSYADGNFGVVYTLGQLRLGFALPRLFGQKYYSSQPLGEVKYSQLRNQLYSASYKFNFASGNFALEPYALYRMNRDLQNFWEAAALLYYKNKIWIGGSYNSTQGTGFFLGMDFQDKIRFGYSYELPPQGPDFIASSSHELHVQIRLGKKRIFRWAMVPEKPKQEVVQFEPTPEEPIDEPRPLVEAIPAEVEPRKEEPRQPIIVDETEEPKARIVSPEPERKTLATSPRQGVLVPGHYVIVGSFITAQHATQGRQQLTRLGYDAFMGQSPANKRYYVYIFSSTDLQAARQARDHFRTQYVSRNAWVLTVE